MMRDLTARRSAYAEEVRATAGLQSDALVAALARVPREARFLIARQDDGFAATDLSPVGIYSCQGARDLKLNAEISRKRGTQSRVQSVRRDAHEPDETCWLHAQGVCLSMPSLRR
jgi:hypothetical protein